MTGTTISETENLLTGVDLLDIRAGLCHDPGEVTSLTRRECRRPHGVEHALPDLCLARVDRGRLDLHQNFSLTRLWHWHVGHSQYVDSALLVESHGPHVSHSCIVSRESRGHVSSFSPFILTNSCGWGNVGAVPRAVE